MFIVQILRRNRRDIRCEFKCEHCLHKFEGWGYDDSYYHQTALPDMPCPECKKKADLSKYLPRTPLYPDSVVI